MNALITAGDNGGTPVKDMRSDSGGVRASSEGGSRWGGASEGGGGSSEGGSRRGRKRKGDDVTHLSGDQLGMFETTPSDSMYNK